MKTNFACRLVSFLSSLSILLQSFAPFAAITPQPIFAGEHLTNAITYSNSKGVFHFELNNKEAGVTTGSVSYSLSYKNELTGQLENVNGTADLSESNFIRDIDAATCSSGGVCVKHAVSQGILKAKIDSANWFDSQWFKVENGTLVVKNQYSTGSVSDLSIDEQNWLSDGEGVAPTIVPTVEPTATPTEEPTIAPTEVPTPTTTIIPSTVPQLGDEEVQVKVVKLDGSYADPNLVPATWTDKADYAPTEKVVVSGKNFTPNYEYTIVISSTDDPATSIPGTVTTLTDGTFTYEYQLDGNYRPNYAVAIKDRSGIVVASTTFTDGRYVLNAKLNGASSVIVPTKSKINATVQVLTLGFGIFDTNNWKSTSYAIEGMSPVCVNTGNHNGIGTYTESFDIAAPSTVGTYSITFNAYDDDKCESGLINVPITLNKSIKTVDKENPIITLIGSNVQIVELGGTYEELNAKVEDNVDTELSATITGTVDRFVVGDYTVYYDAVDSSGNHATQVMRTVQVRDTLAPSVPTGIYYKDTDNNKNITCGSYTNTKHLDVYWDKNADSDFDHYEYISFNADGSTGPIRNFTTNYFNASWWTIPTEGTYGVQIRTVDKAGNVSAWYGGTQGVANSCKYLVDWTAPTISVINPNTLPAHNKTVKATTSDGTLTMTETTGTVCDSSLTGFVAYSDKAYSAESDNGTKVCYKAEDAAHNVSYALSNAIAGIDVTAPVVKITSPTVSMTNSNVDIMGDVTDIHPDHYWLVIQNSKGDTVAGPGTVYDTNSFTGKLFFTWNIASVPDGMYTIKLEARDAADNKDSHSIASRTITVDKTGPITTVSGIDIGWHKSPVTVNFSCADTGGVGCNKTYYAIDGGIMTEGTNVTFSTEGQYAITYYSTDLVGNAESVKSAGTVKIDTTKPTSVISSPNNSGTNTITYVNKWDGSILGTATDNSDGSGLNRVVLSIKRLDGKYYTETNGWITGDETTRVTATATATWSFALPSPTEDEYTITSHAVDNAGNVENSYTVTVVLDKTIPEVAISLNPTVADAANGWYKTQPEITLTGKDTYLDGVQYQWDSQSGTWTDYSGPFKPGTERAHVLYYRAHDKANNFSGVGIKNIAWNQTTLKNGPLNVNVSPNPTSETTSKVKWEAAVSDTIGIDRYEVQWKMKNGSGNTYTKSVGNDVREYTVDNLTEGVWEVKVTAFDASGNSMSASADLTVDRTGPAAPTLSVLGTTAGSVSLSWSKINEANNYIIWYGTVPGSYQYGAKVGDTQSYTVQGLGAGSYYFIVRAVDPSGNQSGNSNEVSTGAIAGAPGVAANTPAQGFSQNVLGANTLTPTPVPTGSVLGAAIAKKGYWWWPWILLLLLPIGWFGYKKWKNRHNASIS